MNFWTKVNTRWTKEQLAPWSSVFKTLYLLFPVIIYYIAGDITEVLLWIVLEMFSGHLPSSVVSMLTTYSETVKGIIYSVGLLVSIAILKSAAQNEILYVEKNRSSEKKLTILKWIGIAILSFGLSVGLNYLLAYLGVTSISPTYEAVSKAQYGVTFVSGIVIYGLISPLVEEVIFRGIIFNRLKRIFPIAVAYIVGAVLFGVFHGNLVQGIYGTLMGLFIVIIYDKCETIFAPLLVHVVANIGVYVLNYTIWK